MANKFITFSRPLKSFFDKFFIRTVARKTMFMQRLRTLQPESFLNALIQTLSFKDHANLADILRTMDSEQEASQYKPFHNQIKKKECTKFVQFMTEKATSMLFLDVFKQVLPEEVPFKNIFLHDGSSLTLNPRLKDDLPGRFTKTAPAAIECHLTLDLVKGVANYIALDADKESEKNYRPAEKGLKDTLIMMDAGYFDISYQENISQSGGFFIVRAKSNINPIIKGRYNETGAKLPHKEMKLKALKSKEHDFIDMDVKWAKTEAPLRIIQFYDRKRKGKGFIITNLDRAQFDGKKVLSLYGLRWQIELFFKELKSFCSLKKVNTANANIVKTLIWASILTLIIKRYVALSVGILWQTIISTQKTCRSSLCWLPKLMNYIHSDGQDTTLLDEVFSFISKNCRRSNIKRDKKTEMFISGLIPYCQIHYLDSDLHKK